jgi:hypothetical protein
MTPAALRRLSTGKDRASLCDVLRYNVGMDDNPYSAPQAEQRSRLLRWINASGVFARSRFQRYS